MQMFLLCGLQSLLELQSPNSSKIRFQKEKMPFQAMVLRNSVLASKAMIKKKINVRKKKSLIVGEILTREILCSL